MYVRDCLQIYMYTTWVLGAQGCQKRGSDPWELELQVFMSCHLVLGSKQGLYKNIK